MLVSPHHLVEEGEEEFANEHRVGSVSSSSRVVLGAEAAAAAAAGATVGLPQLQLSVSKSVPDLTAAVHAAAAYNAAAPWHTPSHTRPPYAAPVGVSHAPATATPTNQYSSPGSVSQLPNEYLDVQTEQAGYQQHQRTPGHRGAGIPPSRDTPTTTLLLPPTTFLTPYIILLIQGPGLQQRVEGGHEEANMQHQEKIQDE